jgi:spermidine synthase
MVYQPPRIIERCVTSQGELQLQQRGEHFEVISNGMFLMATHNGISERRLIQLALSAVVHPTRVLIGGLGVGYSLAEALARHQVERVTVIEIHSQIIDWHRYYFSQYTGNILDDSRTEVICADLTEWIREADSSYDVICLDIDNGPDWLVSEGNRSLYTNSGLAQISKILAPDGVVACWSASQSIDFTTALRRQFISINEYPVEVGSCDPDYIYVAQGKRVGA